MIDIQLLRSEIDTVAQRLATRGFKLDIAGFTALEDKRRQIQTATEQLQSQRNTLAKQVGQAKAKKDEAQAAALMRQGAEFAEKLKQMETENAAVQEKLREFVSLVPNLLHSSVPIGSRPEDAVEQRRWGKLRDFTFQPRDHVDIGTAQGGLDFDTATKLSGARFVVMKGAIARLHRAIAQF